MTEIHISNTLDWQNLIAMLRAKYEVQDLVIKYIDDENDEISINSQIELRNALMISECFGNKLRIVVRKASTNEVIEQLLLIIYQDKQKMNESLFFNLDPPKINNIIDDSLISFMNNSSINIENNNQTHDNNNVNAAADYAVPPAWFTEGLKQMKSEILNEIEERMKTLLAEYKESVLVNDTVELETQRLFNELEKLYVSDKDEHTRISQIYEKLALINAYNAAFCGDANIPDGTKCEPNMKFKKRWIVRNTGKLVWPESCIELVNVNGDIKCFNRRVQVLPTQPNETVEIEVDLLAPGTAGLYYSEWVLMTRGFTFGPKVWCQIQVVEPEIEASEAKQTQTFLFDEITTPIKEICSLNTSNSTITTLTMPITEKFDQFDCESILPLTKLNKSFSITEIDENSDIEASDDEDENAEFVIIPDCLDLTKKWVPREDYLTKSCLLLSTTNKKLIDSSTEPLLPKSDKDDQNLMIFSNQSSTSIISEDTEVHDAPMNVSTPKLEDSNLITFTECSAQQQQQQNQIPQETNEPAAAAAATATNLIAESVINASPSAPPMSPLTPPVVKILNKQPTNVMDKLVSMGFCNRSLNKRLLDKYRDNIAEVIEHLINKEDNDWASNRH